jgi:hypothetical protein
MNIKNNSYWLVVCVIIALGLVALLLGGCGKKEVSPQGGVISEVTMAAAVDEDGRPLSPTSVFPTDAPGFYCSFKLSGFPVGTKIKAKWVYVGGEAEGEVGQNYAFGDEQTGTVEREGVGYTFTVLEHPGIADYKWPKGDYKVVLSVGDEEKASASFKVE